MTTAIDLRAIHAAFCDVAAAIGGVVTTSLGGLPEIDISIKSGWGVDACLSVGTTVEGSAIVPSVRVSWSTSGYTPEQAAAAAALHMAIAQKALIAQGMLQHRRWEVTP